jgi:hypothetical protein
MTKASFKVAGVTSPRQTWADDFQQLQHDDPMLYAWYTCCGMLTSMKNKDENVTRFMISLRNADLTPAGIGSLVKEEGSKSVEDKVVAMARGGFHNMQIKQCQEAILLLCIQQTMPRSNFVVYPANNGGVCVRVLCLVAHHTILCRFYISHTQLNAMTSSPHNLNLTSFNGKYLGQPQHRESPAPCLLQISQCLPMSPIVSFSVSRSLRCVSHCLPMSPIVVSHCL